ncbi:potassium channel family protein [Natronomonas sp.]|uniref:potassium channel family protein n=1 Tax=Natronomonas sp. TaxID=2184060 RepID=UPI002624D1D3|nr:TrkA family potassium uptake protein [Natronomonas sp.]
MKFVIVGAGRVGTRTARVLREEDHEVVIVESDVTKAERFREAGFDVIEGDGSEESTLLSRDLDSVDGIAGLTGDFATNIIACMVGKRHGCRTVLRAESDEREYVVGKYAGDVDEVIYPERLGAIAAKNALVGGSVRAVADIARNLQLVELTITSGSPMRGYSLSELELPADSRLLAFGKEGGQLGLPDADASLESGDRLIVIADFSVLREVEQIIAGDTSRALADGGV